MCVRKADFALILLGKNVYRAIHIDPENDIYPHEKRIYLDVDDVRYQQIDDDNRYHRQCHHAGIDRYRIRSVYEPSPLLPKPSPLL
jgi:hypothetical protein